jgi:hypothetical protein
MGKGLGLVSRNTTNQGDPCPLHKKTRGVRPAIEARHATNPKAQQSLYTYNLTRRRSLTVGAMDVKTGPKLCEDRRRQPLSEDVGIL